VHDLPKATAFYRDVLVMTFLFDAPNLASFQCGEVRLMLTLPSAPALDHPASPIYYREVRGGVCHPVPLGLPGSVVAIPNSRGFEQWLT
jgi:catechol 2,3-dioxygenase-like lactoylglutathione lyase family enzyme